MKFHQALSLLLIAGAWSCAETSRFEDIKTNGEICFGIKEAAAASRVSESLVTPDEMTLRPEGGSGDTSSVKVYVTVADMTKAESVGRGTPVEDVAGLGTFGIYSYFYKTETASPIPYFNNQQAVDKGGYWTTEPRYYWPTTVGSALSFWALAGTDAQGVSVSESATTPGQWELNYEVPQSPSAQRDLMLASTAPINTPNERVPLEFRHLCSAVRFVTGNEMMPGTIRSITLSGVKSQGRYTTEWSETGSETSFTLGNINLTTNTGMTPGTDVTTANNTFMMIPQMLGDNAVLTVVFHDNITGLDRTLTASLKGQRWPQGKVTTYHIGITPEFELEFTQPVDVQDATYVICNSAIRISGIPQNKAWTLTVSASDGSDPSVQLTENINAYAAQGFWTDKEITNSDTSKPGASARGTNTVTGTGPVEKPITIFLPQNRTDANRTVTLSLSLDGAPAEYTATQTITQLHPNWTSSCGWEQIDDSNTGMYRFVYTARHVYVYSNSHTSLIADGIINRVKNLIEQYDASTYVSVNKCGTIANYRNYVDIDYRKLNPLNGAAVSPNDGLHNTRQLCALDGTAVSNAFENALKAMRRVGDSSNLAYRKVDKTNPSDKDVPDWIEGSVNDERQLLTDVLKKNRYYLNNSNVGDLTTTAPYISADDIEWYVPAYEQFAGAPGWYGGASMNAAEYWSSTAAETNYAYSGSGVSTPRTDTKKIRVACNR